MANRGYDDWSTAPARSKQQSRVVSCDVWYQYRTVDSTYFPTFEDGSRYNKLRISLYRADSIIYLRTSPGMIRRMTPTCQLYFFL